MTLRTFLEFSNYIVKIPKRIALMVLQEKLDNMYSLHWEMLERQAKLVLDREKYNIDWDTLKMITNEMAWLKLRLLGKVPII